MEKNYQITTIDKEILIAGATIRTTNANGKSIKDHTDFWKRFYEENIMSKIPNIIDPNYAYGVYTNYETDYTGEYDFTIGYEVNSTDNIPNDITVIRIPIRNYALFEIKEPIDLYKKIGMLWKCIWSADIKRKYAIDFEIYDNSSIFTVNPNVKIFISI